MLSVSYGIGFRFKQLKEQEERRRRQREEERRKAEEAAIQLKNDEPKNEVNLAEVEPGRVAEDSVTDKCSSSSNERHVVNGAASSPKMKDDINAMDYSGSHEDERIDQEVCGTTEKVRMLLNDRLISFCHMVSYNT